jgi:hypothetical protein
MLRLGVEAYSGWNPQLPVPGSLCGMGDPGLDGAAIRGNSIPTYWQSECCEGYCPAKCPLGNWTSLPGVKASKANLRPGPLHKRTRVVSTFRNRQSAVLNQSAVSAKIAIAKQSQVDSNTEE